MAQGPSPAFEVVDQSPLLASNRRLQASLERIGRGSSLWREALEALRGTGRRAFVLTPDQVVVADAEDETVAGAFDSSILAAAAPVREQDSKVQEVLVVVNLPLIQQIHDRRGSLEIELQTDLDRILVHEVYGHALPYLLAGNLSGRCADPSPDQSASDACSVQRENAVREELRLGRRTGYGIEGLWLAQTSLDYHTDLLNTFRPARTDRFTPFLVAR